MQENSIKNNWVELAHKYTIPTLDIVDQRTGEKIPIYLFTEENLIEFLLEYVHSLKVTP